MVLVECIVLSATFKVLTLGNNTVYAKNTDTATYNRAVTGIHGKKDK